MELGLAIPARLREPATAAAAKATTSTVASSFGRFRRRHLVLVPQVASLTELTERIAAADVVDDARVITGKTGTVEADFAAEQATFTPSPSEPFDPAVS